MSKFKIVSTSKSIIVYWQGASIKERAEISAGQDGERWWWINRAIVQPEAMRGQGIGTQMMKKLQLEIRKSSCKRVIVAPGGYGSMIQKQTNFYLKNGFQKAKENKGFLIWRAT